MKRFLFLEDSQGYYKTPYIIETNCNIPSSQLDDLVNTFPGAGRLSLSVDKCINIIQDMGFDAKIIPFSLNEEFNRVDFLIKGVTGNY